MNPIPAHHNPGPRRRILTIDLLRGFALLVIIVDHLVLFPSLYMFMTGQGLLWVTAAEAFFFMSGLMIGMVRGREIERIGMKAVTRKLLSRAGKLYIASIALTIIYTLLALWLTKHGVQGSKSGLLTSTDAVSTLWHTFTLTYVYGWSDFLPYYVVYLLLSPLALWLLRKGHWMWVLGVSIACWILPVFIHNFPFPAGIHWQIYFFMGVVAGYHLADIRGWWAKKSPARQSLIQKITVISGATMLFVSACITLIPIWFGSIQNTAIDILKAADGDYLYRSLLQNNRAGFLRPVAFIIVFLAFAFVVRRYEDQINKAIGWLLIPLGQNSLYVYIIQGVLAFSIPFLGLPHNFVMNTIVATVAIAIAWFLVRKEFLFKIIPR